MKGKARRFSGMLCAVVMLLLMLVPSMALANQEAADGNTPSKSALQAVDGKQWETEVQDDIPSIAYQAHVSNVGWQSFVKDGSTAGTTGQALKLEAIKVRLEGAEAGDGISYRAHVQNVGWQDWVSSDGLAGTTGRSLQVEAFQLKLLGKCANRLDVYYRVHVGDIGWLGWACNGEVAGSEGMNKRIEAVQIRLVEKGKPFDVGGIHELVEPTLTYSAHVSNKGWLSTVGKGSTAGTTGEGCALEALTINLLDFDGCSNGINYRAHVADIGWQDSYAQSGGMVGTVGQSRRMECIVMELSGNLASVYDIYYRSHCADVGWLGWAKNGEWSGTTGGGKQMEAIQITLVRKGVAFDRGGAAYRDMTPPPAPVKTTADVIVEAAYSQLGVPYVYGGNKPGVGLDCSALTQYCYAQAGISIPRNSTAQRNASTAVSVNQARVGDILWRSGHVAIYIGNNQYIHAPRTGQNVKVAAGISSFTYALRFY